MSEIVQVGVLGNTFSVEVEYCPPYIFAGRLINESYKLISVAHGEMFFFYEGMYVVVEGEIIKLKDAIIKEIAK